VPWYQDPKSLLRQAFLRTGNYGFFGIGKILIQVQYSRKLEVGAKKINETQLANLAFWLSIRRSQRAPNQKIFVLQKELEKYPGLIRAILPSFALQEIGDYLAARKIFG
jgi:hypothetical protein